jgi:hypothetical protein
LVFFVACLFSVVVSGACAAEGEVPTVDYGALPNFNEVDFILPQVDWLWLMVLVVVLVIAARVMMQFSPVNGVGGGV